MVWDRRMVGSWGMVGCGCIVGSRGAVWCRGAIGGGGAVLRWRSSIRWRGWSVAILWGRTRAICRGRTVSINGSLTK